MTSFVLMVLAFAAGLVRLRHVTVPPRKDLVAAVGRWDQARARATRHATRTHARLWTLDSVTERLVDELDRRGRDLTKLRQDLAVTGSTLETHLAKTLLLAAIGLAGPPVILTTLRTTTGFHVPLGVTVLLGIALGAAMLLVTHQEVATNAVKRRAEFRRSLSIYLDLVAMSLEAGRGHFEALPAAANIGTGWTFTLLQDAVAGARYSGITPWAALGNLGQELGMPELTDLEAALRLAADDGAKIRATLVARAATLRAARVADAEAEANRATESMRFTLIIMVFAFLVYELYPAVVRLFTG
jgi:tight adherence protein C